MQKPEISVASKAKLKNRPAICRRIVTPIIIRKKAASRPLEL